LRCEIQSDATVSAEIGFSGARSATSRTEHRLFTLVEDDGV
jgi:hypothetical protein